MIPYGKQEITQDDIDSVVDVLSSDFLTQGPKVPDFEKKVADYCGSKYAVAVNSATSALHIACLALDLGPGDWLWTSPITFVASANCGLFCGAKVDFIDIDSRTYNICPKALETKLIEAEKKGCLPKIVIPVHLSGQSCDMGAIYQLAQKYNFKIIEDAAHAIGGKYKGEAIGSCTYSDMTVFSFHPVKIITTGEGGMVVTNDNELAETLTILRNHGLTRDQEKMSQKPDGPWYYEQIKLGFNYRMTDLQAALGISQLKRLDNFVEKRRLLAERYFRKLSTLTLILPWQHKDTFSSWHLYIIRLETEKVNTTHLDIFKTIRNKGVGVNLHYIPVHTQPYYKKLGFKEGDFPNAEAYYEQAMTLPLYPNLSHTKQDQIINVLKGLLSN